MNIGRPRQFNADEALTRATEQFWLGGYNATSLQDLLDCMQLSKSSLYQSFGNKQTLFVNCIENYQASFNKQLSDALERSNSGIVFIEQLLESVIQEANNNERKGCLLVNTANELGANDPVITAAIERGFNSVRMIIKQALDKAALDGDLSTKSDLDDLSHYLVVGISGLRTMVKAGIKYKRLRNVSDILLKSLN